ncbi:MarR family winged helix-turn-helix transcriptional regulator [Ornithinimicrobium sufpigmenti]|uniref:MarR family winged helix-turn-helix transcriptional regulator n=1 Tax=Ornithinimicrobium sufpigmenti TaxID=2508882 RepID=UPI001036EB02|nr:MULTISPECIES: MarR family transcriptional regulator [unclassified Ornithinimicrobium]
MPHRETAELAHDLRIACMRVARRVRFDADNTIAPHHFSVLVRLQPEPRTLGELADIEQVSPPSMSKAVGQLVEQGYVERSADPDDGRLVRLSLTAEGRATVERERAHRDAWMTARLEGLAEADRDLLRRATDLLEELVRR